VGKQPCRPSCFAPHAAAPALRRGPRLARRPTPTRDSLIAKAVIVTVGSAVVGDNGRCIKEERTEVVHAAAHAEAVGPRAVAQAAHGLVVADVRGADDDGAGPHVDAAAEAVAPV